MGCKLCNDLTSNSKIVTDLDHSDSPKTPTRIPVSPQILRSPNQLASLRHTPRVQKFLTENDKKSYQLGSRVVFRDS